VQPTSVPATGKFVEHRTKGDFTTAQRQVFMPTAEHIVNMHIHDTVHDPPYRLLKGSFAEAFEMPDIKRQPQGGRATQPLEQQLSPGNRVNKHARLWLKPQPDLLPLSVSQHRLHASQ
jgi:hypothetical protein